MRTILSRSGVVFLAAATMLACSKSPEQTAEPPAAAASAPAADAKPARDLSALNMCEVVKPDEVAAAAAGKLATEPSWNGKACMYVIEVPSDTESYLLSVYPASLAEALLGVQSPEEKGEKVDGPWDEAWLQARAWGSGSTLLAVRHGDIALEASGDRREVTLAIGKLAGERIK